MSASRRTPPEPPEGRREVLVVSPQFPSPALPLNGIGESAFLAHLPEHGFDPRVVVPLPWRRSPLHGTVRHVPAVERSGGAPVVHPRYLAVPPQLLRRGVGNRLEDRLYRRVLRPEVERFLASPTRGVIHAHSCATVGHALLGMRGGAPLVVSIHDDDVQTTAEHPRLRPRIRAVLAGADHVLYASRKLQRMGHALVPDQSSSVLPWGVVVSPALERREPSVFTVVAVARLVPAKGLDLLLEAFAALLEEVPEARLEIVGDGPERRAIEAAIERLGLSARAELTGALPNEGARARMAGASAFVLPSWVEALGVVYLEAMSLGVPVVGVRGQGIEDVIEDGRNGLLVPPRDADAVRRAMLRLARAPELARRLGEEGRRTFEAGPFSWPRHTERTAEVYRAVLASAPSR